MTWRVFLIGAGAIAHKHAMTAEKLPGGSQIFAADPSETARAAFADAFPKAAVFGSSQEMLASSQAEENDIVILAVPPWLHLEAGLEAFGSGRHVLSEKPIARSLSELDQLIDASHAAGKMLGDCSVRFLDQGTLRGARDLIQNGEIGIPYHARLVNRRPRARPGVEYQPSSKWFLDKEKSGGGAIFDWGVYDLTTFFDVLRPVRAVVTSAWQATPATAADPQDAPITIETHAGASMTITLEDGSLVAFDYERGNGLHGEAQAILAVDGVKGGLSWQWIPPYENDKPRLTHFYDVDGKLESTTEGFAVSRIADIHERPLLAFAEKIAGRESFILDLDRLRFNFAVMDAIYRCAQDKRSVDICLNQQSADHG